MFIDGRYCSAAKPWLRGGMNAMTKVLVVDNGERGAADLLSTELAELGLSSVTTSLAAAHAVVSVIERPSAIFLNMPQSTGGGEYASFARLAFLLRNAEATAGIPVIEWRRDRAVASGGLSAMLRSEVGPQAVSGPEI